MRTDEHVFFIGQVIGISGMLIILAIAIWRRAKEQRDKTQRGTRISFTPPAAPERDRPDWHGAPAGKPR